MKEKIMSDRDQNTDFALTPDGSSAAPPQADDPRYTPGLEDDKAQTSRRSSTKDTTKDAKAKAEDAKAKQQSKGQGVQGQAGEHGGTTNADADPSDPHKTVKDSGPVVTPGTTSGTTKK